MDLAAALKEQESLNAEISWLERVTDGKIGAHDRSPVSLRSELNYLLLEKKGRQKALERALSKIRVVVMEEI